MKNNQKQWIVNATTEARVAHLGLERGAFSNYWWSLEQSFPDDGPTDNEKSRYFLPKSLAVAEAYCFASPNATDATTGASGVVCSSEDFRSLFRGGCDQIHYKVRAPHVVVVFVVLCYRDREGKEGGARL